MLVLSRHNGERIVIDGKITVTVIEVQRATGCASASNSPPQVRVMREELLARERAGGGLAHVSTNSRLLPFTLRNRHRIQNVPKPFQPADLADHVEHFMEATEPANRFHRLKTPP